MATAREPKPTVSLKTFLSVLLPLWFREKRRVKRILQAIWREITGFFGAIWGSIKAFVRTIYKLLKQAHLVQKEPPVWAKESKVSEANILPKQVLSTYSNLRYGLAIMGFVLPPFLVIIGICWYGIEWKDSLSDYYWAHSDVPGLVRTWLTDLGFLKFFVDVLGNLDGEMPMRTWFVGVLFVLGIFLYLYKGFSRSENYLLNGAGLCALGVALFPMCKPGGICPVSPIPNVTIHGLFAVTSFVCIALVALTCAQGTLDTLALKDETKSEAYRVWYRILGVSMIVFPITAFLVTTTLQDPKFTFYVETGNMWAFALYWLIKSNELSEERIVSQPAPTETKIVTVAEEVVVAQAHPPKQPPSEGGPGQNGSPSTSELITNGDAAPAHIPSAPKEEVVRQEGENSVSE